MKKIILSGCLMAAASLTMAETCDYADPSDTEQYQKWLKMNVIKRFYADSAEVENAIQLPNTIACKIATETAILTPFYNYIKLNTAINPNRLTDPVKLTRRSSFLFPRRTLLRQSTRILDQIIEDKAGSDKFIQEAIGIRETLSTWTRRTSDNKKTNYIIQEEYINPMLVHVLDRESAVMDTTYSRYIANTSDGIITISKGNNCHEQYCGDNLMTPYNAWDNYFTDYEVCEGGLYGINSRGTVDEGNIIYRINEYKKDTTALQGVTVKASNIAAHNGQLLLVEQLSKTTRDSIIHRYDLSSESMGPMANTNSYPIYRSAFDERNQVLKATSMTYLYDFDLDTGKKTVLGKFQYPDDSFKHGDIAYADDGFTFYVLTGKALYRADLDDLSLTEVGQHGIYQASGLAYSPDGKLYVSGYDDENKVPALFSIDPLTAIVEREFTLPHAVNDLTYVSDFCYR